VNSALSTYFSNDSTVSQHMCTLHLQRATQQCASGAIDQLCPCLLVSVWFILQKLHEHTKDKWFEYKKPKIPVSCYFIQHTALYVVLLLYLVALTAVCCVAAVSSGFD
jgi:hypothetical protein